MSGQKNVLEDAVSEDTFVSAHVATRMVVGFLTLAKHPTERVRFQRENLFCTDRVLFGMQFWL